MTKFDSGGRLVYSTVFGGEASDTASRLAVNSQGEVFVVGYTNSKSFPVTPNAFQKQAGASGDGFAVKLLSDAKIDYATYLPNFANYNPGSGFGVSLFIYMPPLVTVALESGGAALVGGSTGMLARISDDGSSLTAVSQQPGQIFTMETDAQGSVYIAGQIVDNMGSSVCSYGIGVDAEYARQGDIYITKLQAGTLKQAYFARIDGYCQSRPGALSIGPTGEVTFGAWSLSGFPVDPREPIHFACGPPGTAAIARLSRDGSAILFSTSLDMCGLPPALAVSPDGNTIYGGITPALPYPQISTTSQVLRFVLNPSLGARPHR